MAQGNNVLGQHERQIEHRLKELQGINALVVCSLAEHQPELLGLFPCSHAVCWLARGTIPASQLEVIETPFLHTT